MSAFFRAIPWWIYAVVAAAVIITLGAAAYLRGRGAVVDVGIPAALEDIKGTRAELERSQEAIRAMSRQIQELSESADRHKAAAAEAGARAAVHQQRAAELRSKVEQLEARPRLAPVQSAQEARAALKTLGGY